MADVQKRKLSSLVKRKEFNPGGEKGKLHREMGVPEGQKIPEKKLKAATRSPEPEKRRDAIRAETMKGWHHTGKASRLYGKAHVTRGGEK